MKIGLPWNLENVDRLNQRLPDTLVYKNHGIKIDVNHIDYNDHTDPDAVLIDYNDKKVLDYIGTGRTEGVFRA